MPFLLVLYCACGVLGGYGILLAIAFHWRSYQIFLKLPALIPLLLSCFILGFSIRWISLYNTKQDFLFVQNAMQQQQLITFHYVHYKEKNKKQSCEIQINNKVIEATIILPHSNFPSHSSAIGRIQYLFPYNGSSPSLVVQPDHYFPLDTTYYANQQFIQIPDTILIHYPITKGMLLGLIKGQKQHLPDYTLPIFQTTGTSHALAISGMHVGIWWIFAYGIWYLPCYYFQQKRLLYILIIISLWGFAWVAGFPISAVRAVGVTSLFLLLKNSSKFFTNSQICLYLFSLSLVLFPSLQYNIGFLLSFSASFSLIQIAPKIQSLPIRHTLLKKWIITPICISIIAQLGTFTVAYFSFPFFPTYSILCNLFFIPFITISLIYLFTVNLLFIFCSPIFLIQVYEESARIIIKLLESISMLPYSSIRFPETKIKLFPVIACSVLLFSFILLKNQIQWKPFNILLACSSYTLFLLLWKTIF